MKSACPGQSVCEYRLLLLSYPMWAMLIVIPRFFSSFPLSISSNLIGLANPRRKHSERVQMGKPFFDKTCVIAAVSVVFPWSICPIVPTFKLTFFSPLAGAAANVLHCCLVRICRESNPLAPTWREHPRNSDLPARAMLPVDRLMACEV